MHMCDLPVFDFVHNVTRSVIADWKRMGSGDKTKNQVAPCGQSVQQDYLTIIPRARMGYWLRAHEGERNNCFSKIQLVGQKNIEDKTSFAS